jgi:hypothetical protein
MVTLLLFACTGSETSDDTAPRDTDTHDTDTSDTYTEGGYIGFDGTGSYATTDGVEPVCSATTLVGGAFTPIACEGCEWIFAVDAVLTGESPAGCAQPPLTLVEGPDFTDFLLAYAANWETPDGDTVHDALVVSWLTGGERLWGTLHSSETEDTTLVYDGTSLTWTLHQVEATPDTGGGNAPTRDAPSSTPGTARSTVHRRRR